MIWPVLLAAGIIVLAALLWYPPVGAQRSFPAQDAPYFEAEQRVDINTADMAELTLLPGIGEKKAEAIIAWRRQNGPFESLEDLQEIDGIGPKIVEGLRELAYTS